MKHNKYFDMNRFNWNQKANINYGSEYYDVEKFKKTLCSLYPLDHDLLGNIKGKKILHLMCHFGMDTISMAYKGADVTGVDFSDDAIKFAKKLSTEVGVQSKFICSNVYDIPDVIKETFDIVYMTYGTIGWLPDLFRLAEIIYGLLNNNGFYLLIDSHPIYWMFGSPTDSTIVYPYESGDQVIEIKPEGTYADENAKIEGVEYWWNHGISKIINSLISNKLQIQYFNEYNYDSRKVNKTDIQDSNGNWTCPELEGKYPLMFAVKAKKL